MLLKNIYKNILGDYADDAERKRVASTDEELAQRLVTDPHSPSEYRTAVVRNLDAWYEAFGVQASDPLYLAPDQRVRIW